MDLDLRLVRYAVTIADRLHFGRAATELLVTEQTLSAQIKHLEERLGVSLFHRDRRHVELTSAGEVFVERGRRLLADSEDLLAEVARHPLPLVVDIMAEGLLPDRITRHVRVQLRDVPVEVRQGQGLAATLPRVQRGEVDLAFGRFRGALRRLPKTLRHSLVRLGPIGLALPTDHDLAGSGRIPTTKLRDVPLLLHSPHEAAEWRDWVEELVVAFDLEISQHTHGHGLTSAYSAVLTYHQPMLCPIDLAPVDGVVVRPLFRPVPLYPWSAVWQGQRPTRSLPQFLDLMADYVTARGWLVPPKESWWLPDPDWEDLDAGW